jgi:hypothetical protein
VTLIERLRETASKGVSVWGDLQKEAADTIEAQAAEIDELLSETRTLVRQNGEWQEQLTRQAALIDLAKRCLAIAYHEDEGWIDRVKETLAAIEAYEKGTE